MQTITKQDKEDYCNGDKQLISKEINALTEILKTIETLEYRNWKNINGGFSEIAMTNYDDETIDFQLEYGEQDMGGGHSSLYVDNGSISRKILLSNITLEEKIKAINW